MAETQIAVEAQYLTKVYGKGESAFQALKDLSLQVRVGESLAIVGKSGSGKSTLMHLLALMDSPTAGDVAIMERPTAGMGRRELDQLRNSTFGFVFQQFFLNGRATVLENVILPLKIAGVSAAERKRRGMEALRAVELEYKAGNRAMDLSGGQKQRVVIARALVNDPSVLFCDEPTGNLDSTTGELIEDLIFRLNRERGITLIVVTHDPDLAEKCDRQAYIKDGELVKETSK